MFKPENLQFVYNKKPFPPIFPDRSFVDADHVTQ